MAYNTKECPTPLLLLGLSYRLTSNRDYLVFTRPRFSYHRYCPQSYSMIYPIIFVFDVLIFFSTMNGLVSTLRSSLL